MATNGEPNLYSEVKTPQVSSSTYSPVTVYNQDSLGALILGILSLVLLFGWMRAEERNRKCYPDDAPGIMGRKLDPKAKLL